MAVARVVTFEGASRERIEEIQRDIEEGDAPEFPASELVMLHDPDAQQALVIIFFENEEDYRRADEVLSAMPAEETPGRRTSVARYEVALRATT